MTSPHWGDVPGWVAAIGTVGTFTYGFRLLGRENDRAHRADEQARRAQAVAISAAVERTPSFPDGQRRQAHEVVMLNASQSPVYDVNVYITRTNGVTIGVHQVAVLLPGERHEFLGDVMNPLQLNAIPLTRARPEPRYDVWADVWFHDAAGHTWQRDHRGALHDLQPMPERTLLQLLTRKRPGLPAPPDFPPVQEPWSATEA